MNRLLEFGGTALAVAVVLLAATCRAQGREWFGGEPWPRWTRASGSWAGLRDAIPGVEFNGSYIADWTTVASGGVRQGRGTYRSLTDVNLSIDLNAIAGLADASVFLDAYSQVGRDGSLDAGDIQVFSNIDNPNTAEIAELFYEQLLFDGRLRVKVGKVDANNEFNYIEAGADYLNSSATLSPSIFFIPTYPDPATSVNAFYQGDSAFLSLGVYDGATAEGVPTGRRGPSTFLRDDRANSYFWIFEQGLHWQGSGHLGPGRGFVGLWHHSANFQRFDGGVESDTQGFYAQFEQRVWSSDRAAAAGGSSLDLFFVLGRADGAVSPVERHHAVGLRWAGLLPRRPADSVGFLFSQVDLSDDPAAGFARDETAYELYYKIQVTGSLSITPDVQFIDNPSGDPTIDDALVAGVRFNLTF